jgi:hypothetical protein
MLVMMNGHGGRGCYELCRNVDDMALRNRDANRLADARDDEFIHERPLMLWVVFELYNTDGCILTEHQVTLRSTVHRAYHVNR